MQICEHTGRAGCISGPPKAHTRPLAGWNCALGKLLELEVPFFLQGAIRVLKGEYIYVFWVEFHLKARTAKGLTLL
jgi:hypothetical protein